MQAMSKTRPPGWYLSHLPPLFYLSHLEEDLCSVSVNKKGWEVLKIHSFNEKFIGIRS
jgi:hypothetical protein